MVYATGTYLKTNDYQEVSSAVAIAGSAGSFTGSLTCNSINGKVTASSFTTQTTLPISVSGTSGVQSFFTITINNNRVGVGSVVNVNLVSWGGTSTNCFIGSITTADGSFSFNIYNADTATGHTATSFIIRYFVLNPVC